MKEFILHTFAIYLLLVLNIQFSAAQDGALDVTKTKFPYMAFLYYPDETVKRNGNNRYFQNAILIKSDWLISASTEIGNNTFPIKTLLARAGVVIVDRNFTFNEDDGEQEREIIQVVLPENHNVSMKLATDVSLLKTLLPFNTTESVMPVSLNPKFQTHNKLCEIVAFVNSNGLERKLVQIAIELLPPTECGKNFFEDTMTCGSETDIKQEYKGIVNSQGFCEDNAGGPLICDNEVMGIQVYLEKEACKIPRLYHLISKWDKFINCGTRFDCRKDVCDRVCKVTGKDDISETHTISTTAAKEVEVLDSDKSTRIAPVYRTPNPSEKPKPSNTKETSESQTLEPEVIEPKSSSVIDTTTRAPETITTRVTETVTTITPEVLSTTTSTVISTATPKVSPVKLVSSATLTNLTINTNLTLSPNSSIPEAKTRKSKKHRRNGTEKLYFFADLLFGALFTKWLV